MEMKEVSKLDKSYKGSFAAIIGGTEVIFSEPNTNGMRRMDMRYEEGEKTAKHSDMFWLDSLEIGSYLSCKFCGRLWPVPISELYIQAR